MRRREVVRAPRVSEALAPARGLLSMGFDNMRKAAAGEDLNVTPSDVSSVRRLTPWASLPYWRWFIDGMLVKEAKEAVE